MSWPIDPRSVAAGFVAGALLVGAGWAISAAPAGDTQTAPAQTESARPSQTRITSATPSGPTRTAPPAGRQCEGATYVSGAFPLRAPGPLPKGLDASRHNPCSEDQGPGAQVSWSGGDGSQPRALLFAQYPVNTRLPQSSGETVDINGATGTLARQDAGATAALVLTWSDGGTLFLVHGIGITRDELLAFARGVK